MQQCFTPFESCIRNSTFLWTRSLTFEQDFYYISYGIIHRLTIAATSYLPPSAATAAKYLMNPYTQSSKNSLIKLHHQIKKYSQNTNTPTQKKFTCQSPGEDTQKVVTTTGAPEGNETAFNDSFVTPGSAEEEKKPDINDENTFLKADVYEKRKFIIPGLGHFEDYNIEVCRCN